MNIIYLCGFYNLLMAIFHINFSRIFKWKNDLAKLSFVNKGIMQIMNVQLVYFFFFVAFVCFTMPQELLNTQLGHTFLIGNSLFWLIRAINQYIFLRYNHLIIHLLTVLFSIGAILFSLPLKH